MAHLAFSTLERSSRTMPSVRTLHHGAFIGVKGPKGGQASDPAPIRVRIWRIRVGFSCDVSHGALPCLNGVNTWRDGRVDG
ncbi:MAG: hypothetical protein CM15mP79_2540 [Methanobacteriota archaeon]|nr:MAG: hypothetical protein CM15mP79_2540 [Euryarchaeota archaeon]